MLKTIVREDKTIFDNSKYQYSTNLLYTVCHRNTLRNHVKIAIIISPPLPFLFLRPSHRDNTYILGLNLSAEKDGKKFAQVSSTAN